MLKRGVYTQLCPVLFGEGVLSEVGAEAKKLGAKKVLIVTDSDIEKIGYPESAKKYLKEAGIDSVIWSKVETDAPDYTIRDASAFAREQGTDVIVGLGGGSVLDSAKAIAAVVPNGDQVLNEIPLYLTGQKDYETKPLTKILVPTTAGTGSESTFVAVVTSEPLDCKIGLPSLPDYAIVDPVLTKTASPLITAFTGMDAFSHAHEALTEGKNNPHSDLLAYEAIRLVTKWLPTAVKDGENLEARANLAFASNIAGISFNEAGVHMGHSTAHALGHMYHVPHGVCCALVTPSLIEFVAKAYPAKIKMLGEAMDGTVKASDPKEIGKEVAEKVRKLLDAIKLPSLKNQGFTKEQIMAAKPKIFGEPLCTMYGGDILEEDVEILLASMYESY